MALDGRRARALLGRGARIEAEIRRVQRQELLARPAVVPDRGLVDGEEGAGLRVLDPHRLRVVLEEDAVALLARPQRVEHAHPLRDFAGEEEGGLLAVVQHGARAHLQHHVEVPLAEHRLEAPAARDRRPGHAGVGPERVHGRAQHLLAGDAVLLASPGIRVLDDPGARVDDDQGLRDALEEVPVSPLHLAQHLLRGLLFDHAAELRTSAGDP